jgi:hypothetical protein
VTPRETLSRERVAELVSAATYGTVLVLAALSVMGVGDVAEGRGAELIAGVGIATWLAHLFAELLGGHVRHADPLHRSEIARAMVDGSPILAGTLLPAFVLFLGRLDVLSDRVALLGAIVVTLLQLLAIGAFVASIAPSRRSEMWTFAAVTAAAGACVVALTVWLGH